MLQATDLLLACGVTWSCHEVRLAVLSACYGWTSTDVSRLSAFLHRCAPLLSTAVATTTLAASCSDSESAAVSSSSSLRAHLRAANPLLASLCSPSGATLPVVQLLVDAIGDSDSELSVLVNSPVFSYDWNVIVEQALSLATPMAATSSLIKVLCEGVERAGAVLSRGVLTLACARVAPEAFVHLCASQARVVGLSGEAFANIAVTTLRFDTLAALEAIACSPTGAAFHAIAHATIESFSDCRLPLVVAIRGRHGAVVDELLQCGVDVRARDGVGVCAGDCVREMLEELQSASSGAPHAGGGSMPVDVAVLTAALSRVQLLLAEPAGALDDSELRLQSASSGAPHAGGGSMSVDFAVFPAALALERNQLAGGLEPAGAHRDDW
jgi:hypothetical protein